MMNAINNRKIVIKFHGSQSVNGIMELILHDAKEAVMLAAADPVLNRQVTLDLKELLAIAENNDLHMRRGDNNNNKPPEY